MGLFPLINRLTIAFLVFIHHAYLLLYLTCLNRSDPAQQPGAGQEGGENAGGPPGPPPNLTSNRRLQQTQAQVEEVSWEHLELFTVGLCFYSPYWCLSSSFSSGGGYHACECG